MRRIRCTGPADSPDAYRTEDVPAPEPGPGELLVRTEAIGATLPAVRKLRAPETTAHGPVPLSGEVAGTVEAVGPDVPGFAAGDRVTGLCFTDAYAELAVLHRSMASAVPPQASAAEAVALVRSGLVACGAYEAARPRPGESVLVTAAASGVGSLAVQYAKAAGAGRVVGAVGSRDKTDFVRSLGADQAVTYGDEDWGEPVDVLLDGVGGELLGPAVRALAPGGRLTAYSSGGGTVDAHQLLVRSASVTGFQLAAVARHHPDTYARRRDELWQLHRTGALRPRIAAEFPLAETARAHALIDTRANLGKVILVP